MKTAFVYAVLFAMTFACRETFIDLSREEYGVVTFVKIEADRPEGDGSMSVPKEDETSVSAYMLRVYAYNHDGMPLFRPAEWRVSDPTVIELSSEEDDPPTHEARAYIRVLRDIFDLGGDDEPSVTVTACVINDCEDYGGSVPCEPEICSDPLTVKGVVNAEGDWELEGATFPFPVPIRVRQTGRNLEAAFYEPEIHGRQINFSSGNTSYLGQFTDSEHVTGEAILSPSGDNLGVWTAVKCPDTGCD